MTTSQLNTILSIIRSSEKQIKQETGLELKLSIRDLKGEVIGLRNKVEFISNLMGYDLSNLQTTLRHAPLVKARAMITGIIQDHLGKDYNKSELGRLMNKDHATIINYEKTFKKELEFHAEHVDLLKAFNNYISINS